ncbi:MAG: dTMP kinase [Pseudomonadota bacterium]
MRLKKGILIVFEGIDGAGKSTQARILYEELEKRSFETVFSKEPTDSVYGLKIRDLATRDRDSVSPEEEYHLFVNDRRIHVAGLIKPSLVDGKIVILDRYYHSTMAYQGALGLDMSRIREENESFAPRPDVVFLLRILPGQGLERIRKSRNEMPNLFEREEGLKKVAVLFDSLNDPEIIPLDANEGTEAVHRQVMDEVDKILKRYQ